MACTTIMVDGEPVLINLVPGKTAADLTEQDMDGLRELVRATKARAARKETPDGVFG